MGFRTNSTVIISCCCIPRVLYFSPAWNHAGERYALVRAWSVWWLSTAQGQTRVTHEGSADVRCSESTAN